ncbi:MAG: sugar kinase [Actinomycetota bacterium]|nr:sugar kinase [Actinomycetota bacterium]
MADVVSFGETMALLSAPRAGRLRDMSRLRLSMAGAETNVCIGVARLGRASAWLGRVGRDEFGELVLARLRAEGVDVAGATTDADAPTGVMVKELRRANTARVTYYRRDSAGSRIAPEHLDRDAIAGARILHLTGITPSLGEGARAAVRYAVEVAHEAGVRVSLDVNYRSALWSRGEAATVLAPLAADADIVFAGEDEVSLLGADPIDAARSLVSGGVEAVVIKRGGRGASSVTASGLLDAPARPVRALDPVGAGDGFVAGYLAAYLDGLCEQERLDRGCAVGAFVVSTVGDWEGLPTLEDLRLLDADGETQR